MVDRRDGALTPAAVREALHREGLVPPRILTLSMTGVCNLFCTHCWVDAGQERSLPVVPQPTIRRLLEEFAALGGEGVRLTGGEPLSHPGWRETLQLVRDLGLARLVLQTNGTLLDEAAVATLAALDFPGLQVQISLDGARARSHDRVRGEGTFAAAMQGVRRLVAAGLGGRIIFAFTEMRHNLEEFPLLLELAESLGVGAVVGGTLITGGRAAGEGDGAVAPATPDQYLALVARFEADADFRRRYQRIGNLAALEWLGEDAPAGPCCTFVEQPYLTPTGDLYPCLLCHSDAYAVSGVFAKSLAAAFAEGAPLWSGLRRICQNRPATLAVCQGCPELDACGAGCPGRALGSSGDLLVADDRCALRQAIGRHRRGSAKKS